MASKGPELKFQPRVEPATHEHDSTQHGLETIPGGRSPITTDNEQFAAERTRNIELKIQSLEDSSRKKSPENQSSLDAARLEILSKQLPHARGLQDNLSAMNGLKTQTNDILRSMQRIIAPQDKRALSFAELLDAWANISDEKLGQELSSKLTEELNELNIRYGQLNAEYQERYNMHLETQNRLAELQDSLEEVEALKQEIVDDITSRIQVKKQGGSLIAESSSAMFEQIGTYLKEYESTLKDTQQDLINTLSQLEESLPVLEKQSKVGGTREWFKQLFKKTPDRGYARDRLVDARAKKREILKNLERLTLIQRALGFASGHVGVTPAGLSNLESHMDLGGGAGVIAPAPQKDAPETFARFFSAGGPASAESFEFGPVQLIKDVQKRAREKRVDKKETIQVKPLSDAEAAYLRTLKSKKSPAAQEPAISEIPSEEIHLEASIPPIPVANTTETMPDINTPSVEDFTPQRVKELRGQTTNEKANDIMEMALKGLNTYVDTAPETIGTGYEKRAHNYINLIISPEEAQAVAQAFDNLFEEVITDEKIPKSVMRAIKKRITFVGEALLKRANEAQTTTPPTAEQLTNQDEGGSTSPEADVETSTPAAATKAQQPAAETRPEILTTQQKETTDKKLDLVMGELTKRMGPIIKSFNKGELAYDNALKQALSEMGIVTGNLAKKERAQLKTMYVEMIEELKETRKDKGKEMPTATEQLLRDIAKRIDPDWVEPKKPTGRWRKWLAGILGAAAIGGAVSETARRAGQDEEIASTSIDTEKNNTEIEPGKPELVAPSSLTSEIPQESKEAAPATPPKMAKETSAPELTVEAPPTPSSYKKSPPVKRGSRRPTTAAELPGIKKLNLEFPSKPSKSAAATEKRGSTTTPKTTKAVETAIPEDTDSKSPERLIDTRAISDISKMGIAEQSLLRDAHIAFKKVSGLPRLVKAKGYLETDSTETQEKAIRVLEAAAKKVKDNQGASGLDRQRAENILTAIQYHNQEGLL